MDEKKGIAKIAKYFVNFQYGLSIVMALLLLAMIGYEVVMRYVFKSSLMGVEEVMVFPIIWLYMLGGHPVLDKQTGRVNITSQNHGFAVDADTLPDNVEVTHVSLFDGSLQGMRFIDAPAMSFQGHPEASPGPHDIETLFDKFVELMKSARA